MDVTVSVETTGEVDRLINIEIPYELFDRRFNASLSRVASHAQVKGFRPGRAPRALLLKLYGTQINDDVLNELVSGAYRDAIRDKELKVVGSPRITVDQFEPQKAVKVKAEVSLLPEPEIKGYHGLAVDVEIDEVRDEDLEKVLDEFRERNRKVEALDRDDVQAGDIATVTYAGLIDGQPFRGSEGKGLAVEAGKGQIPEEIDNALLGMRVGESRSVELTMPEEAGDPALVGKSAIYTITVTALGKKVLPELDDEFVKSQGAAESVEALREDIRGRLKKEVEDRNRQAREAAIFRAISEKNPFQVPLVMVDDEIRSIFFEQGMLDPKREESYQFDLSQFRESLGKAAEERIRRGIILARVIEQEKISASDEDIERWVDEQAERMGAPREKVAEAVGVRKNAGRIKGSLAARKASDLLLSEAKIQETVKDRAAAGAPEKGNTEKKRARKGKAKGAKSTETGEE